MNLVGIVGSPRPHGNSSYLVDCALEEAAALGAETEKVILGQHTVHPCRGHQYCASLSACSQNDDAVWILEHFYAADAVILASPVYYYNVTAQMKAFIDRSYFYYTRGIRAKAGLVGLVVVAESVGIEDTLHTLNQFVDWACAVPAARRATVSGHAGPPGAVRDNAVLTEEARQLGRSIAAGACPGP